jgi:hypothetical protein
VPERDLRRGLQGGDVDGRSWRTVWRADFFELWRNGGQQETDLTKSFWK